ncbi:hypothetical protein [Thermobifida cellulosilytica]|jgi:hypothetical protein|uniref:Uncharacterized protein n=1 Tax=Thermobifida cellulosilytica TB100 TaxID=665004 RepID=A0A147KDQ1_THECS|nr:hypothetical protein [Thermobifida cellulosilytica]KUP95413.1 hypothetical protein AC529_17775 [Thermobifida cellulosilytica TB100]
MLTSIVRTTVPFIVGALSTLAVTYLGVELPEAALTELVTVLVAGAYYTAVRLLEEHVSPAFGRVLLGLGLRGRPKYDLA